MSLGVGSHRRDWPSRMPRARQLGIALVVALLSGSFMAAPARAQTSAADSAAVVLHTAEQFHLQGRTDVAEALFQYLLERFPHTPAADAARSALDQLVHLEEAGDGRVELQVWGATYGLWLGIAVPAALGADGSEAFGVGLLVGGPGGFLLGSSLARSRPLSTGQARAITLGGTWGTWQGWGWSEVFDWGVEEICSADFCYEDADSQAQFLSAIAGGLTGLGVGTVLSRRSVTPGQATTINLGALWGTWFGLAGGVLADAEGDGLLAWTLLGGNVGLVGSALAYPSWNLTRSRARLISIAGVIGGLAGAGVDLLVQPDDEKAAIAIPLVTSITGLAIGAVTTRSQGPELDDTSRSALGPGALLQLDAGRWDLGAPLPLPASVDVLVDGQRIRATQAHVTLFRARF